MSGLGNREIMSRNLSYYMERSGRTQKEVAEIIGIATSTLNDWMKAKSYPRIDKIELLANYFGIQKSDLIEERLTPEKEKDNDIMTDIIVRMRIDKNFLSVVSSLYKLDAARIEGVKQMLQAFGK